MAGAAAAQRTGRRRAGPPGACRARRPRAGRSGAPGLPRGGARRPFLPAPRVRPKRSFRRDGPVAGEPRAPVLGARRVGGGSPGCRAPLSPQEPGAPALSWGRTADLGLAPENPDGASGEDRWLRLGDPGRGALRGRPGGSEPGGGAPGGGRACAEEAAKPGLQGISDQGHRRGPVQAGTLHLHPGAWRAAGRGGAGREGREGDPPASWCREGLRPRAGRAAGRIGQALLLVSPGPRLRVPNARTRSAPPRWPLPHPSPVPSAAITRSSMDSPPPTQPVLSLAPCWARRPSSLTVLTGSGPASPHPSHPEPSPRHLPQAGQTLPAAPPPWTWARPSPTFLCPNGPSLLTLSHPGPLPSLCLPPPPHFL